MKIEKLKEIENSLPEGFKIVSIHDNYVSYKYQLTDAVELKFLASIYLDDGIDYFGFEIEGNSKEVFKYVMNKLYNKGENK